MTPTEERQLVRVTTARGGETGPAAHTACFRQYSRSMEPAPSSIKTPDGTRVAQLPPAATEKQEEGDAWWRERCRSNCDSVSACSSSTRRREHLVRRKSGRHTHEIYGTPGGTGVAQQPERNRRL